MKLNLAILSGDGIGPEVVNEALKVTHAIADKFGHEIITKEALVGGIAIENTGSPYPDETHEICLAADAVLFGAIGMPKYDNDPSAKVRPEQGLLKMRKELGLYANIRPIETFEALLDQSPLKAERISGVDFVCVRELTGGIYFGKPQGRSEDKKTAYDSCVYTYEEVERIVRLSFEYALKRNKKLTVVDKANVLATSRLWREVAQKLEKEYLEVTTDYLLVDSAAMLMITNPKQFDVLVTENMFGDILTDEASVITGSMGLLPSASIGVHTSVFEPIHGSYPQAAGKNIANPMAAILSAAMLFEYAFNLKNEAKLIRLAVSEAINHGVLTEDLTKSNPYSTSGVGNWIRDFIVNQ